MNSLMTMFRIGNSFELVLLKDKSIARIYEDGMVLFYYNPKFWKKDRGSKVDFYILELCSKEKAKDIVTLIDNQT